MLKPAKILTLAAGLCFLAAELPAQGGLGAPPGQMGGGGARGGSGGRAPAPSGRIPEAAPPSDRGESGAVDSRPAGRPERANPSRPVGSILTPGSPGGSASRSSGSSNFPGFLGQPNILSPGNPGPYRPGSILTPGTPPAPPATGGIFTSPNRGRDRSDRSRDDRFRGDRGSGRGRRGAVVYPYVYYGYPYSNSSYADGGAVVRTSPNASYVIEGHLDEAAVERRSRVYEVGPRVGEEPYSETEPVEDELAADEDEPASDGASFDLVALQGGLIYAVHEHWLLGNTVHFVTLQGDHYVVSLPEVDLDLSVRLNRERGRKFLLEVREHDSEGSQGSTP